MSKRRLECHACGRDVTFEPQYGYQGPDITCQCGEQLTDHKATLALSAERLTLGEAMAAVAGYTFDQIMDMARKLYDNPESATSHEIDVVSAFNLLRAEGLTAHGEGSKQ